MLDMHICGPYVVHAQAGSEWDLSKGRSNPGEGRLSSYRALRHAHLRSPWESDSHLPPRLKRPALMLSKFRVRTGE